MFIHFTKIEAATDRVWLETYIWDDSHLAEIFVDALIAAKRRGCDVLVLVDYVGSSMTKQMEEQLSSAGIDLGFFNPILGGIPMCCRHIKI